MEIDLMNRMQQLLLASFAYLALSSSYANFIPITSGSNSSSQEPTAATSQTAQSLHQQVTVKQQLSAPQQMHAQEKKALLKQAFAEVIENMNVSDATYEKYFSKNYIQQVDGKTLKFADFVAHMKAQKRALQSIKVEFQQMFVDGDKVMTLHTARAIKKDGKAAEMKVFAFFVILDNKIVYCDELTHLIQGDNADKDLGSRLS